MAKKVILIADPGIDTAFAVALALLDPNLEVVGLLPTAGNVSAQTATANVNILIDQLDPSRWPRTAAALSVPYDVDAVDLHGSDGLGNCHFTARTLHNPPPADKVLVELIRENPHEVSVICMGPATTIARGLDRDPEIVNLIDKLILIGGSWKESGNVTPAAEFHFYLDPDAVRQTLHTCRSPIVIPLEVTRRLILSPTELLELPNPESKTCQFLRKIVPYGIRASMNLYGIEGFHLADVMGVALLSLTGSVTTEARPADIETRGELTRGMFVVDSRKNPSEFPVVQVGVDAAIGEIRQYINRILKSAI